LFPYNTGDDRSIVIIGASFVDYVLEQILLAFFPNDETEVDTLLNYDQPLGTFGNKVRMIYCLGLIDGIVKDDLKLIGKIRNKFAHDLYASFEDDQIRSWCRQLRWHCESMLREPPEDATTRDYFQVGVHQVIGYLNGIVSLARTEKRKIRRDH
jgi:DNA-binding MltR family transcriptional regulator